MVYVASQKELYKLIFEGGVTQSLGLSTEEYSKLAYCSLFLLEGLPDFLDAGQIISSFHNRSGKRLSNGGMSNSFANIFWMYDSFPKNYYKVLAKFFETKKKQIMYMQKANYERLFEDERYKSIQEMYNLFILNKIDAGEIRRDFSIFKSSPELLHQRSFVRKEEVKTTTGMSNDKLTKLSRDGKIKMIVKQGENDKYLVDHNSLNKLISTEHRHLSKKEVGLLLGIHVTSVDALVAAGMLTPISSEIRQYVVFDALEVNNILEVCRGRMSDQNVVGIPFRQLIYAYNKFSLSIVKVLEFTRGGLLNPICISEFGTLAHNIYLEREVNECIILLRKERQTKRGYYFTEVCALLSIGEKKLNAVLKVHQIDADLSIYMADGRKKRYFKRHTVENYVLY